MIYQIGFDDDVTMCYIQSGHQWLHTTMASRRVKIDRHFDDLEEVYFNTRRQNSDTLITSELFQSKVHFLLLQTIVNVNYNFLTWLK